MRLDQFTEADEMSGTYTVGERLRREIAALRLNGEVLAVLTELATTGEPARADELLGEALVLLGPDADQFAPLLKALANRAHELEELRTLADTEPLTGLANRRVFAAALWRELARHSRHGGALSVVLFDLDALKALNDNAGHAAGDRAIRELAGACTEATRSSDLAARVGGDEFALLLPDTDAEEAALVAERVRSSMAAKRVAGRPLGVSVGVATANKTTTSEALLTVADARLYRDKRARQAARVA
jgi:diguanylate cyclase (GGDEF)-like protein